MSVQIEKRDHNMATITISVGAEDFEKEVDKVFRAMKGRINVPGFRKGKAPRQMIEKIYGAAVFFEDAANNLIPGAYQDALAEIKETIVSRPEIDIAQMEKGKDFIFTADVALKPGVVLGAYKGLEIPEQDRTVTDAEVDAWIERERESNARMIDVDDRPVENGDSIKLNFDGSVDGVPFEGGKSEDYPLTVGSGSFIPGFEEQIVGRAIGEDFDVNVTFPEEYGEESLAGKDAVFACRVNSIQVKELPELDDDFAQDVSEFETLEEYRADVRKTLQDEKDASAKTSRENAAADKAADNAEIDIPEAMIAEQVRRMKDDFKRRVESQGMQYEQYMQIFGMNDAALTAQMEPEAVRRIRNSLTLEAVADAEGFEVTDEQVDDEVAKMAEQYGMDIESLKTMMGEEEVEQIRSDLKISKALDLITETAVEVPVPEETAELDGTEE